MKETTSWLLVLYSSPGKSEMGTTLSFNAVLKMNKSATSLKVPTLTVGTAEETACCPMFFWDELPGWKVINNSVEKYQLRLPPCCLFKVHLAFKNIHLNQLNRTDWRVLTCLLNIQFKPHWFFFFVWEEIQIHHCHSLLLPPNLACNSSCVLPRLYFTWPQQVFWEAASSWNSWFFPDWLFFSSPPLRQAVLPPDLDCVPCYCWRPVLSLS